MGVQIYCGKGFDTQKAERFFKERRVPYQRVDVLKYGIVSEEFADQIPDEIVLSMPKEKSYLSKPELFMLDLLDGYQWDRPIHMLSQGGEINIGQKDYLMYEGFSSKFVPIRNRITSKSLGLVDVKELCDKIDHVYTWEALRRTDYCVDYQNLYTFLGVVPQRELFLNAANLLLDRDDAAGAEAMLDKAQECVPEENFPLESICLGFYHNDVVVIGMIEGYYKAGAPEKARELAARFSDQLLASTNFFLEFYDIAKNDFEMCCNCFYYLADTLKLYGDKVLSDTLMEQLTGLMKFSGES